MHYIGNVDDICTSLAELYTLTSTYNSFIGYFGDESSLKPKVSSGNEALVIGSDGIIYSIDNNSIYLLMRYTGSSASEISYSWKEISGSAVKLDGSSNEIKFGIDSDGNYGYIKAGADSVTPFKSNNGYVITNVIQCNETSNSYRTTWTFNTNYTGYNSAAGLTCSNMYASGDAPQMWSFSCVPTVTINSETGVVTVKSQSCTTSGKTMRIGGYKTSRAKMSFILYNVEES